MPNVRIQHPSGIFSDAQHKKIYMKTVAVYVAQSLDCDNDAGNPINLTSHVTTVDVTLVSYMGEDARLHDTDFVVEVMGIDYRDRMKDIGSRMENLKEALMRFNLGAFDGQVDGDISLMFIPVSKDCWV